VPKVLSPLVLSLVLAFAAAFVPSLAAAQTSTLAAQNAWARKPPGVDTAAVYFVLANTGQKPVTVVGATSSVANSVMIHESAIVDGQSRMRMKDKIVVPPGKTVAFAPEGLHVMVSGFRYDVLVGDSLPLTLQLEGGGKLNVTALVRPLDTK
jgi:periplasmic copper chaperone A